MLTVYLIICGVMSLVTLIIFAIDKIKSKSEDATRIPEIVLLSFISLGGAFGGFFGMYLFRHKTRFSEKFHFGIGLWFSLILQLALAAFIALVEQGSITLF
ncbi:MAG: DUF1294 domain-containing protein [Ruminococcaceae bacterium]|nr:DUF1294 domain-containing protein [Oscillospiraceae bacterium]